MTMTPVKYMTAKEFRDDGFLQEVNRQFFHPLGLALAVYVDDEGFDDCFRVSIWDERDDPEGWFFAPGELSKEKADKVEALRLSKADERCRQLGTVSSVIQLVGQELRSPYVD